VVLLALSAADLGRLQQRHANLVRINVFHGNGDFDRFRIRLDEIEIRERVDRGSAAYQP